MKENPKFEGIHVDPQGNKIPGTTFTGWYSRSMAVVAVIRSMDNKYALVEQRGAGCPDNIGKYCMPCGYLNWDETLVEAVIREVYEEIGMELEPANVTFNSINDNIQNNRQNVSVRYNVWKETSELLEHIAAFANMTDSKERGGEELEVSSLLLVDKAFVKAHIDDFAFNHGEYLLNALA